jgi:hypothetical protein
MAKELSMVERNAKGKSAFRRPARPAAGSNNASWKMGK